MVFKVIATILVFLIFVFSFAFMFQNLPQEPVALKVNYLEPRSIGDDVDYGAVSMFATNMRFNHNLISYSIESGCDEIRRNDMISAFNIFSSEIKVISFYELPLDNLNGSYPSGQVWGADIKITCSDEFIELGGELFAAGEGGPSRIINTSGWKVIEEGRVILYNSEDCRYPIVAVHELGHVFGFDHSGDPMNIMYNTSDCWQRMSPDMGEVMRELYSIEALADARVESIEGVVRGRYLDFNISVLNEGLIGIDSINLTIFGDGEVVDVVDLGEIDIGYGRTLRVENMRLNGAVKVVEFVVDADNLVREIREDNNAVEMRV